MTRFRFPVSALALGLAGLCAAPSSAQEARVEDIQISQGDGAVSILVKLSQQPKSASATQSGNALVVEIDGVALPALAFDPAGEALVRHVAVTPAAGAMAGSKIRLEGAAFGPASTTIYRNAVLIETRLAEPSLPAAASLMAARPPATETKTAPPAPAPAKPSPPPPVAKKPADVAKPADTAKPAEKAPPVAKNALELRPLSATAAAAPAAAAPPPAPLSGSGVAALVKLDAAGCSAAEAQLAKDAWSLPALGDRALCLIDQQKYPEAKNRIDQLAAFSPEDWRVLLGRGALAEHEKDASAAEIAYRNAAALAPDGATRDAIERRITLLGARPSS